MNLVEEIEYIFVLDSKYEEIVNVNANIVLLSNYAGNCNEIKYINLKTKVTFKNSTQVFLLY
jgi:hypothetical protein